MKIPESTLFARFNRTANNTHRALLLYQWEPGWNSCECDF